MEPQPFNSQDLSVKGLEAACDAYDTNDLIEECKARGLTPLYGSPDDID